MPRKRQEPRPKIFRQTDPMPPARPWPYTREFRDEHAMHAHIIENLETIEPGMELYEDVRRGVEYPCKLRRRAKRLDILAVDTSLRLTVIECKRGSGLPTALGQLLGYMGWVREHLCCTGEEVRGILVVGRATTMLLYAVRACGLPIEVWECRKFGPFRRVMS